MQNHTVIPASVFVFRHGVVNDLVDFRSSVKYCKESFDNLLVVGDVLL